MLRVFSCPETADLHRGPATGARERDGRGLPCQDSNNCTEQGGQLTGNHRKTAYILAKSVAYMVERFGIERVGFLTLTFAEHITDARIAQKRFHSLKTHVLNSRYGAGRWIRVLERQKSGRIHYHLLVACSSDIRSGVVFSEFEAGNYKSAGPTLRAEWAFWRTTAPKYRFGRTELLPVRSSAEAIGRYVGKYIAKHIDSRIEQDKGVRLVSAASGALVGSTRFSWTSPRASLWRLKLGVVASWYGFKSSEDFQQAFGSRWAYKMAGAIMTVDLVDSHGGEFTYPDADVARADGRCVPAEATGPLHIKVYSESRINRGCGERVTGGEAKRLLIAMLGPEVNPLDGLDAVARVRLNRAEQVKADCQSRTSQPPSTALAGIESSSPDGIDAASPAPLAALAQERACIVGTRPVGGGASRAVESERGGGGMVKAGLDYWRPSYKRGGSRVVIWGNRDEE